MDHCSVVEEATTITENSTETIDQTVDQAPKTKGWAVQIEKKKTNQSSSVFRCYQKIATYFRSIVCGWIKDETIKLIKLAFPIILTLIFQNLILFISLVYVGHISNRSLEIDSAALAISFMNITGISVGIGLSTAADTLCSQAYGFKNYKRVGHIFQQGVLILFLLCLFVWCVWLNTESFLLLVQQKPCVARYAGHYVQIFCLALPPIFLYWMLQKYLQAQSIVWPFIITGFLAIVTSAIFHAIFVIGADLGVNGASLSLVLSYYCLPIFLIIYIRVKKLHKETWGGWSWESLRDWWQFLKLGLPGMAMICLEWISYEIAAFVLGSISEIELAANSIMINIIIVIYMVPLGISIAGSVRIGNELGAGNPKGAKRVSFVCLIIVVCNALFQMAIMQSTKNVIGHIYTNDSEVLERIPVLVNVVTVIILSDQTQLAIQGIIRGCGHQLFGAIVNFIAFYIIGLPLGITLALCTNMGSVGMWIGLGCANYIQAICYVIYVFQLNWKKQSDKAVERAKGNVFKVVDSEEEKVKEETEIESNLLESDEVQLLHRPTEMIPTDVTYPNEVETNDFIIEEFKMEEEEYEQTEDSQDVLLMTSSDKKLKSKSNIKLFLCRSSLYLIAAIFVVFAGILSQFHPSNTIINGNYSECTHIKVDLFSDPSITTIDPTNYLLITCTPLPTSIPLT